jgi:HAD superfamily hydrolase (TIGR01509 family)
MPEFRTPAVLFGSIGAIADTSELQREAFNRAFSESGLDWHWDRDEYAQLLADSGGEQRIAHYAEARGESVDAGAVHRTKSALFQRRLTEHGVSPRPGVDGTIAQSRRDGYRLGLVTTTSAENVAALAAALRPGIDLDQFDLILDRSDVSQPKPEPDIYELALRRLEVRAQDAVAIEDNLGGVASAAAAGIPCVAFPSENNAGHAFEQASARVSELSLDELRPLIAQG